MSQRKEWVGTLLSFLSNKMLTYPELLLLWEGSPGQVVICLPQHASLPSHHYHKDPWGCSLLSL